MEKRTLSQRQIESVEQEMFREEVRRTYNLDDLLYYLSEGDTVKIKEGVLRLFKDFKNINYLRDQYRAIERLLLLYLKDEDFIDLLVVLSDYFEYDASYYETGVSELDISERRDLRELLSKSKIIELYIKVLESINDSGLKKQYEDTLNEMIDRYSKLDSQYKK